MRLIRKHSIAIFASIVCLSTACPGDSICIAKVSANSWCKPESGTCQGDPSVKCNCDKPKEKAPVFETPKTHVTASKSGSDDGDLNHSICTSLDPESWCREDKLCARMNKNVPCGSGSEKQRPVEKKRPVVEVAPVHETSKGSDEGPLNHLICTAIDPESWCREDRRCARGHDKILCGGPLNEPSKTFLSRDKTAAVKTIGGASAVKTTGVTEAMVLWTEWPSLEEGGWPEYFETLLAFIRHNCGGLGFHKLVMRVLNPHFQAERGQLWQISKTASFYKDFLVHLPANVEVHIYPYLLEADSARTWSRTMKTGTALEGVFKYVHVWNRLLEENNARTRVAGIVTDKEEGREFLHHIHQVKHYKSVYSGGARKRITFGIAIGYDCAGSISALSKSGEVDEVYLEMYDFYVEDRGHHVEHVHAHKGGALNNPHKFLDILDEHVWSRQIDKYHDHLNIIFMWSLQNEESDKCIYPTNGESCGTQVDFGSWKIGAFRQFLETLAKRHKVFANRQHALFQLSFVPKNWMPDGTLSKTPEGWNELYRIL